MSPILFFFWALLPLQTPPLSPPAEVTHIESMPAASPPAPDEGDAEYAEQTPPALPDAGETTDEAPLPAAPPPEAPQAPPPWLPLPPSAPSVEATRFRFKMGEGFFASSEDGHSELRLRSMAQVRTGFAFEGKDGSEFSVRGVRVLLEGRTLERRLVLSIQTSLGADEVDGGSGLLDAWLSWKFGRDATLRLGQQRVFYDMAGGMSRPGNLGIQRENASQEFGMVRDVGAALFSEDFLGLNEWLGYRLGLYGGQGRNRVAFKRSGFLCMARLTLRPFGYFDDTTESDVARLHQPRLAVGLSAAHASKATRAGAHSGAFFDSFAFPALDAFYWNVDAMFKWRGFYFAGQYSRRVTSTPYVENGSERVWGRSGHGYLLRASGMLSTRWELAGRWSQQFGIGQTAPTLLEQPKNEFALGVNHYFIGQALKAQLEYSARFSEAKAFVQSGVRLQVQVVF